MPSAELPPTTSTIVYVGTYTKKESRGIYVFRLAPDTGKLTDLGLAAEAKNPSFLAVDAGRHRIFAVSETSDFHGKKTGAVSAYQADPGTGKLTLLNQGPSEGEGPCYVALDPANDHVLVANYGSGSVAVLPVAEDGQLGSASAAVQHQGSSVHPKRQQGPHAHSIQVDPSGTIALAADLGLDQIRLYDFDKGTLKAHSPEAIETPPGAGPRHFAFHPSGKYLYVATELANTLLVYSYDAGATQERQSLSLLPPDYEGTSHAAEVLAHPSGKFVYASNRGHDSIAVFTVDEHTGSLTPSGHVPTGGKTPRNFGIDPSGRWLIAANQESGNLVVFEIDQQAGTLTNTGITTDVDSPVCVRFLPAL